VRDGLWVAYVDASRTLAPAHWARMAAGNTLWVVRPPAGDAKRGAWCADILLRNGAFALVVLDGAPLLTRSIAARLSLLARDAICAFSVTGENRNATMLGGALRIRLRAIRATKRARERCFAIDIEKGGSPRTVEVS